MLEREKKKDPCGYVQENIRKMMASRLQPVQLAIQHVRDRRQRMPVHGMNVRECPGNAGGVKTACYLGIFIDVTRIVIVNEVMPKSLTKNNARKQRKTDANAGRQPAAACFGESE